MNNLRLNLVGRNLFYLYNSSKDNINPEGICFAVRLHFTQLIENPVTIGATLDSKNALLPKYQYTFLRLADQVIDFFTTRFLAGIFFFLTGKG